jgi:Zn-dependent protease
VAPPPNQARTTRWSLRIATLRGIPISIHATFFVLMVVLGWRTAFNAGLRTALVEQGLILTIFVCVVLHELGHAAIAVRFDVPISGITLYPFGGVARMAERPPRGAVEVAIASAGPAVNLALAAVLLLISSGAVLSPGGGAGQRLLSVVFWANLILAGFNLMPAFPLDGGRMLRGWLTGRMGWARATVWAASIGQIAAVTLLVVGVTRDLWLVLAGLLILPAANAELRYALAVRQFVDRRVRDLARRDQITVDGATALSAVAELSVGRPLADFLLTERGRVVGYLSAARLWSRLRSDERGSRPVASLAERLADPIPADTSIEDAAASLDPTGPDVAPVVDGDGTIIGVVVRGDLERAAQLAGHARAR